MVDDYQFAALQVVFQDGAFCVASGDGFRPLCFDGRPVARFNFGWRPVALVDVGADAALLELLHENGDRATWFVDRDLNRLRDRLEQLDDGVRSSLGMAVLPYVRAVYETVLQAGDAVTPQFAAVFAQINSATALDLLRLVLPALLRAPRVLNIHDASSEIAVGLDMEAVRQMFADNVQDRFDEALVDGQLTSPSILTGQRLRTRDSLAIHEHRMAYRFVDGDTVFYVGTTHHTFKISEIYVPSRDIILVDMQADHVQPIALLEEYLAHCASHAEPLVRYLGRGHSRTAVVLRGVPGMHIGHHIWNELTALDRILAKLEPARLPIVVVPNAEEGSEPFGPVEQIMLEFQGLVDRSFSARAESLGWFAYSHDYFMMRILDEKVSTRLSERLQRSCAIEESSSQAAKEVVRITSDGYRIIVIGVRVENRTAVDVLGFLSELIEHVSTRLNRVAFVIDGHNARLANDPSTCFTSLGQPSDLNPPLLELGLVMSLRQRHRSDRIEIVNAVGLSPASSIVWCKACDFFVAFWGAGLAKYRWVCNKPGLVLSSAFNLTERHDLRIYDSPVYQESPERMEFVDRKFVTDRPDRPVYFSPIHPTPASYCNFDIEFEGLAAQLNGLIDVYSTRAGGPSIEP